MTKKVISILI